jgi:hypothetical protein
MGSFREDMGLDNSVAKKFMKLCDGTEADAVRALRPGGPIDTTLCQTHCLKCGKEINHPLRWFDNNEWMCSCGGQFDYKPFVKALVRTTMDYLLLTGKTLDEIEQMLLEDKDS